MTDYRHAIATWQQQRDADLRNPDGWLTLAGLFWLEPGRNTFGADDTNTICFPHKAAPHLGEFIVTDDSVLIEIAPGVSVTHAGVQVNRLDVTCGGADNGPALDYGPLRWFVIRRDGRWAVRLRDREHPALSAFHGVQCFPINPAWRVEAQLIPHTTPLVIPVPNILGSINQTPSLGVLHFSVNGEKQSLVALGAVDRPLFLIFADATSGKETYGSGRFLAVDAPDANGRTHIDFNRAYNPPCAFTPFATCPLPPAGNRLHIPITAGEKKYGNH